MLDFAGRWLLFASVNLLAAASATIVALRLRTAREGLLDLLAAFVTLFASGIVLVETALGLVGGLAAPAVLAATATIFAILVLDARRRGLPSVPPAVKRDVRAAVGLLRRNRAAAVVLFLGGWVVAGVVATALAEPSTLPDTLSYHLPEVANWLHAGSLVPIRVPYADPSNSYFPISGGLLYAWVMLPLHGDLLVRLVNVGTWCGLGIGVMRLSTLLGASGEASLGAALLLLFTPLTLAQANETSLDVAGAGAFVLALGHFVRFCRDRSAEAALLFTAASGLFLGLKYSAPAYLPLLGLPFAVVLGAEVGRRRLSVGRASCLAGAFVLGASLLGGYGYVRNFAHTGNPMYPVELSLGGWTLPGLHARGAYHFNQLWWRWHDVPLRLAVTATLQAWGVLFPLALAASAPVLWRRPHAGGRARLGWLAALVGATLVVYLLTPYSLMVYAPGEAITGSMQLVAGARLGQVTWSLAAVFVAAALSASTEMRSLFWLVLSPAIVEPVLAGHAALWGPPASGTRMVAAQTAATLALACVWLSRARLRALVASPRSLGALALAATLVAGVALRAVERHRERRRYATYERWYGDIARDWKWVDDHLRGARIVVTGSNLSYPFYGSHLDNEVRCVEGDGQPDAEARWLQELTAWRPRYVVAVGDGTEAQWVAAHGDRFGLVFKGARARVYRIE